MYIGFDLLLVYADEKCMKLFRFQFMFLLVALVFLSACVSSRALPAVRPAPPVPELIMGNGSVVPQDLAAFLLMNNPAADAQKALRLACYYLEESAQEGVNSDVAFAQMCVETGFLKFGGLVTAEMNNFCGLGSIDPQQPGLSFEDERTGVRAHVQHLKAYGSAEPLVNELVDPRYRYVNPKGKSPAVAGLAGTWAADLQYGEKLNRMLGRIYAFSL